MAVLMELTRIFIREMTDMQIIELSEVDGERSFPIVIGLPEAFAIERRLKDIAIARPQTHDLLASCIRDLGGKLREIVIHDLEKGIYFAKLVIEQGGRTVEIDSRPSDAIAIGVAESVPIYVAEHVLAEAAQSPLDDDARLDDALGEESDAEEDDGPSGW
ncbi:MAG TPA: bifunctional nuclease family protein [Phycisphaerales bacterium]|nr:bifunctional nuclease family protein [Phycisphaerales bacterium]HMP38168.1 bifunctional nuclease family protein [Phycisphaerales bacterium]